jgi:hypothetical protein
MGKSAVLLCQPLNRSVGGYMLKVINSNKAFILLSIFILFFNVSIVVAEPVGRVIGHSECNDSENVVRSIIYKYTNDTLFIRHKNAIFNCCFENISAKFTVKKKKITISSEEDFGDGDFCLCDCNYDVEYEIKGLPVKKYTIYINDNERSYKIKLNLSKKTSGELFLD